MKKYLLLSILLCGCSLNAYSSQHWEQFLKNPDQTSYKALEESVAKDSMQCGWGNPENQSVVPVVNGQKLFKLIAGGNEYALRIGLIIKPCLDGGELHDFHKSTGDFFDISPNDFLSIAKDNGVDRKDLKYMLTAQPDDAADNIDRAIEVIENRISLLGKIKDPLAKIGLEILNAERESLNEIKQNMG